MELNSKVSDTSEKSEFAFHHWVEGKMVKVVPVL
jgi:hypothetical protein